MNGPASFVSHLQEHRYHPRSDAHSNAICLAILQDLLMHCPCVAERAADGELVAKLNHTVKVNYQDWNIDLALGPPPGSASPPAEGEITMGTPAVVEVALEAKCIMTEHGKARRNRLRDLQAFHHYAHVYNQKTVAIGSIAINVSPTFWSPLRDMDDVTYHDNIDTLGPETIGLFRSLPLRHTPDDGPGFEAASVVVVEHDNLLKNPQPPLGAPPPRATRLVVTKPAPQQGDPLHYATMIHRTCVAFGERWGQGPN